MEEEIYERGTESFTAKLKVSWLGKEKSPSLRLHWLNCNPAIFPSVAPHPKSLPSSWHSSLPPGIRFCPHDGLLVLFIIFVHSAIFQIHIQSSLWVKSTRAWAAMFLKGTPGPQRDPRLVLNSTCSNAFWTQPSPPELTASVPHEKCFTFTPTKTCLLTLTWEGEKQTTTVTKREMQLLKRKRQAPNGVTSAEAHDTKPRLYT